MLLYVLAAECVSQVFLIFTNEVSARNTAISNFGRITILHIFHSEKKIVHLF